MTRLLAVGPTAEVSGAEGVLLGLLDEARARGWEVLLACPDGDLAARRPAGVGHLALPELALPPGPRVLGAPVLLARSARAGRLLRRAARSADAVLVNGFLALPAVALGRLDAPVTWLVHDVLRRPEWFAVLKAVGPAVDRVVAVSHAAAAPLRERGLDTVVVHNGVTWPVDPAPLDHSGRVVGCVAALTPWKGHEVLLDAAALLPDDVRLELAGTGFAKDDAYVARLRARADAPDLRGRVRFLGRVDALATMRRWTVGVSASVEPEACPLVVLEGMSVGLPLVATALGGSQELLEGGVGTLVPPSSPEALAAGIMALLEDPQRRAAQAARGREAVAEHFRADVQRARQLDAVLRRTP